MIFSICRNFCRAYLGKDYYSILGLKTGAESKDIRLAYLTLAKKYHPDSPTGNTEKFKEIANAYEILNDPRVKEASKLQQERTQTNKKPKPKYEYDEYYRNNDFEDDQKGFNEWRKQKKRSYAEDFHNFEANGYYYYDPHIRETKRYTFSKFKRDKYNNSYRPPKKSTTSHSPKNEKEEKSSFYLSGIVAFGLVVTLARG